MSFVLTLGYCDVVEVLFDDDCGYNEFLLIFSISRIDILMTGQVAYGLVVWSLCSSGSLWVSSHHRRGATTAKYKPNKQSEPTLRIRRPSLTS